MGTPQAELEKMVSDWLKPISEAAPGGQAPNEDERFMAVKEEMTKQLAPDQSRNWELVLGAGGDLIATRSKHLLIAAYLTHALHATEGEDGLSAGLTLIAKLVDTFWTHLFPMPANNPARANALEWLSDHSSPRLQPIEELEESTFKRLHASVTLLSGVLQAKFPPGKAPTMGKLHKEVRRLGESVRKPVAQPPPPPLARVAPPPTVATSTPAARPEPSSPAEVTVYLNEVRSGLVKAAHLLRRANAADPLAYRLLRAGAWLHLSEQPPAENGKTKTAGPSAQRENLRTLAANGSWAALLETSESLIPSNCFSLDLQRFSANALKNMGPTHASAHRTLIGEVSSLLQRMPQLAELLHNDNSPLADAETKTWIAAELKAGSSPGTPSPAASKPALPDIPADVGEKTEDDDWQAAINDGPAGKAIALLHERLTTAKSGEARFRLRLTLANVAFKADKLELARGIYETLEVECEERGLEDWSPKVASAYLQSHILCLRELAKRKKDPALDGTGLYRRLCRIDPAAALELGT